jgi:hypothetical protein
MLTSTLMLASTPPPGVSAHLQAACQPVSDRLSLLTINKEPTIPRLPKSEPKSNRSSEGRCCGIEIAERLWHSRLGIDLLQRERVLKALRTGD